MFVRKIKKKTNGKVYVTRYLTGSYKDEKENSGIVCIIAKYTKETTKYLGLSIKYIINTLDKISFLEYTYENKKVEILPNLIGEQKNIKKIKKKNE